jgi:hypothetical protein
MPTVLGVFLIIHELTLHDVLGGLTLPPGGVNLASAVPGLPTTAAARRSTPPAASPPSSR